MSAQSRDRVPSSPPPPPAPSCKAMRTEGRPLDAVCDPHRDGANKLGDAADRDPRTTVLTTRMSAAILPFLTLDDAVSFMCASPACFVGVRPCAHTLGDSASTSSATVEKTTRCMEVDALRFASALEANPRHVIRDPYLKLLAMYRRVLESRGSGDDRDDGRDRKYGSVTRRSGGSAFRAYRLGVRTNWTLDHLLLESDGFQHRRSLEACLRLFFASPDERGPPVLFVDLIANIHTQAVTVTLPSGSGAKRLVAETLRLNKCSKSLPFYETADEAKATVARVCLRPRYLCYTSTHSGLRSRLNGVERVDVAAEKKRDELFAHTHFSSADALTGVRKLVLRSFDHDAVRLIRRNRDTLRSVSIRGPTRQWGTRADRYYSYSPTVSLGELSRALAECPELVSVRLQIGYSQSIVDSAVVPVPGVVDFCLALDLPNAWSDCEQSDWLRKVDACTSSIFASLAVAFPNVARLTVLNASLGSGRLPTEKFQAATHVELHTARLWNGGCGGGRWGELNRAGLYVDEKNWTARLVALQVWTSTAPALGQGSVKALSNLATCPSSQTLVTLHFPSGPNSNVSAQATSWRFVSAAAAVVAAAAVPEIAVADSSWRQIEVPGVPPPKSTSTSSRVGWTVVVDAHLPDDRYDANLAIFERLTERNELSMIAHANRCYEERQHLVLGETFPSDDPPELRI